MTAPERYDVVVIGGGQSGLATGYHLRQAGLSFVILEAGSEPVGSWPHYYDSLRLFSPAPYASLPGLPFPGGPDHYPRRNEVINYLRQYASHFSLPVQTNARVEDVLHDGTTFTVRTQSGTSRSRVVIAASGAFSRPYLPSYSGQERFEGTIMHAFEYRNEAPFANKRVVVVGGGNSAVQIAAELSRVATVTLATREPIRFLPQRFLGRDIHFWLQVTGLDYLPLKPEGATPIDSGGYRRSLQEQQFGHRSIFTRFTPEGVTWATGEEEAVDVVLFATGYRRNLTYLTALGALDQHGEPVHRHGVSSKVPGLYFLGLPFGRNLASATLRGAGPDAAHAVRHALKHLRQARASCFFQRDARTGCTLC